MPAAYDRGSKASAVTPSAFHVKRFTAWQRGQPRCSTIAVPTTWIFKSGAPHRLPASTSRPQTRRSRIGIAEATQQTPLFASHFRWTAAAFFADM